MTTPTAADIEQRVRAALAEGQGVIVLPGSVLDALLREVDEGRAALRTLEAYQQTVRGLARDLAKGGT